jgi:hypothetical protein
LIIAVLVFDLGLAAAGAYLLSEGLSAEPAKPSTEEPTPVGAVKPSEAKQPEPVKQAIVAAPVTAPPPPVEIDAGIVDEPPAVTEEKTQGRKPKQRRKPPKPIDPYGGSGEPQGPALGPPPPPPPPEDDAE